MIVPIASANSESVADESARADLEMDFNAFILLVWLLASVQMVIRGKRNVSERWRMFADSASVELFFVVQLTIGNVHFYRVELNTIIRSRVEPIGRTNKCARVFEICLSKGGRSGVQEPTSQIANSKRP